MTRVLGLLIVSLLFGCGASLQEIREQAPAHTGDFPRPYQVLARCVYDRLDMQIGSGGTPWAPSASPLPVSLPDLHYRLDDQPRERRARVSASSFGPPSSALFEITIVPTAEGGSRVEYRQRPLVLGSLDQPTWAIVTDCGQS